MGNEDPPESALGRDRAIGVRATAMAPCTRDMGEGVNLMKKLNVRSLETLKTTAAAYGSCPIVRV